MKRTIEWLKERQAGIGGSDCAAVLGLAEKKTPAEIYLSKTTEITEDQLNNDNDSMFLGRELEPIVIKMYERKTQYKCDTDLKMIKSEKYPWLLANLDGLVFHKNIIVEAKTAAYFNDEKWGENGTDEMPTEYLIQCAHYCLVLSEKMQVTKAQLAVLGGFNEFRLYNYYPNKKLEQHIIGTTHDFWYNYVLKNELPPITKNDSARLIFNETRQGTVIVASKEVEGDLKNIKELQETAKLHEKRLKEEKNKVQLFMGDNETLIDIEGNKLATWKTQNRKEYIVKANSFRVFKTY
jgi:putative phage-type endonuclease